MPRQVSYEQLMNTESGLESVFQRDLRRTFPNEVRSVAPLLASHVGALGSAFHVTARSLRGS